MKTILPSIAAAMGAIAVASGAQAQDWYVRGDVGGTFQGELDSTPKAKADSGWTLDAALGRQLTPHVRAEIELLYADADGKDGSPGKLKVFAGLLNGYYDFAPDAAWQPFVGAGVGLGQVKLDGPSLDDDDTGLAWQLQTGVRHPINDRLSAQVAYRYMGVSDVKIGSGRGALDGDYRDQAVTVGLTYKFGP